MDGVQVMFENIGWKIKKSAKVICVVGIVALVVSGIATIVSAVNVGIIASDVGEAATIVGEPNVRKMMIGVLMITMGPLLSWIVSLCLYGFGELIEKTTAIAELMAKADAKKNNEK